MERDVIKPNGPAAAAILSAGVGVAALGLFTFLAESSKTMATLLKWSNPVGPLSGKTGMALIVWLVFWAFAYRMTKGKSVNFGKAWGWAVVLIILGLLLTFPPVFKIFAG